MFCIMSPSCSENLKYERAKDIYLGASRCLNLVNCLPVGGSGDT